MSITKEKLPETVSIKKLPKCEIILAIETHLNNPETRYIMHMLVLIAEK